MHELVQTAPANDTFIAKRKSRWPFDACVIHARFTRDEIINLAARHFAPRFARNNGKPVPHALDCTLVGGGGGDIEGEVSFRCRCG